MTLLIESPWLGLLPAVCYLVAYRTSRKRLALVTGLGWLGYSVYEYGMSRRWLCSGECNIRIDLLLIYPLLVLASVMAAVVVFRTLAGRGPAA